MRALISAQQVSIPPAAQPARDSRRLSWERIVADKIADKKEFQLGAPACMTSGRLLIVFQRDINDSSVIVLSETKRCQHPHSTQV